MKVQHSSSASDWKKKERLKTKRVCLRRLCVCARMHACIDGSNDATLDLRARNETRVKTATSALRETETDYNFAPTCMAIACLGETEYVNEPFVTVTLEKWEQSAEYKGGAMPSENGETCLAPVHAPEALAPLTTSQYVPAGSEVLNVARHTEPLLLIAT